ncbi:MAG TPA: hypothetical protein VG452_12175 [Egibacteraceae bacterium]|nr:hypothetical protein [Egibacteraceae bacterium]
MPAPRSLGPGHRPARRTRRGRRWAGLGLAAVWLLVSAPPAGAVSGFGIDAPSGTVTGASAVAAFVEQNAAEANTERIAAVESRFLLGGAQSGSTEGLELVSQDVHRAGRTSHYRAALDPFASRWTGGRPMANGSYRLQVRVITQVGAAPPQTSEWRERQIVLEVPPPQTTAAAKLVDPARRTVEVSWRPVGADLPDFVRYVVERSVNGGRWSEVRRITRPSAGSDVDTVGDGEYRYRVTVVRSSGSGGELSSPPSAPSTALRVGDTPGQPGQPGTTPGAPGEPGAPGGPDAAPDRIGIRRGAGGPRMGPGAATPPRIDVPGAPAPVTAPSAAAPAPGDDAFRRTLPYGDVGGPAVGQDLAADESGLEGDGTLTIFDRQLVTRDVVVPVAAGLVLMLLGLHIRRFLNQ